MKKLILFLAAMIVGVVIAPAATISTNNTSLKITGWTSTTNDIEAHYKLDRSNVKFWGAKGDTNTDDTAAIQATIDAATLGGIVKLPGGTYNILGSLYISNSITFEGDNHFASILLKTNAGYALQVGSGTIAVTPGIVIRGLKIVGGPSATGGILMSGTYGAILDTLHVTNFSNGYGIHYSDYNWIGAIHHLDAKRNYIGLRVSKSQTDQAAQSFNAMVIDGQGELHNNQWGVLIGSTNATDPLPMIGMGVSFQNITVEGNYQGGIWDCGTRNLSIDHCYFEGNGATNSPAIRIGSLDSLNQPIGVSIQNNIFLSTGICIDLQRALIIDVSGNTINSAFQFLNCSYGAIGMNAHDNWYNTSAVTVEKSASIGYASTYSKLGDYGIETYGASSWPNGSVSIGTNHGIYPLEIVGTTRMKSDSAGAMLQRWDNASSGAAHMNWGVSLENANWGDWNLLYSSTGSTGTPDTVAMTINRYGNVSIGTNAPAESMMLDVNGNVKAKYYFGDGSLLTGVVASGSGGEIRFTNDVNANSFGLTNLSHVDATTFNGIVQHPTNSFTAPYSIANGYSSIYSSGDIGFSAPFSLSDTTKTKALWQDIIITNGISPTPIHLVMDPSTTLVGGTGNYWVTNQAILHLLYYPGMGTNAWLTVPGLPP